MLLNRGIRDSTNEYLTHHLVFRCILCCRSAGILFSLDSGISETMATMNADTLQQSIRKSYEAPGLIARVKSQGYQVTVLQNCDSIYIADPSGIGCIFDTRTAEVILRKLDEFFNHIRTL